MCLLREIQAVQQAGLQHESSMEIEEVTYMDFVTLTILLQQYQLEAARLYLVHPNRYQRDCNNGDSMQRRVADIWNAKGRASDHGIATIDGYYLVAVGSYFGSCGDLISFTLEGGIKLNCLVADEKNAGDSSGSVYGHWQDYPASGWSIIEWESMGGSDYSNSGALLNVSQWQGKKVTAAINGGRYQGL